MSILPSVFVSYSREDSNSIQYAVRLLEAGGAEVFRDLDDIRFGERWEDVITKRIADCERVLVFWSKAAQQSEWVGREYKMGLKLGKKLVPILLDNTPLPADLGVFHALTLANFMPKTPAWKRYGGWVIGGLATTALAGVLGVQFLQTSDSPAFEPSSELALEQNVEEGAETGADTPAMADSVAAVESREVFAEPVVESPPLLEHAPDDNDSIGEAAGDSGIVTYHYQTRPKPVAAPSAPGTSPLPEQPVSSSDSQSDDQAQETDNYNADNTQISPYLLWIMAALALLSLGWLVWRRYTQTSQQNEQAISERFVDSVFDDR